MTRIIWDPKAQDFLDKMEASTRTRLLKKFDKDVLQNVRRYIKHLEHLAVGKLRIGDYRLFVDYDAAQDELTIRSMRHRHNAYKKE